MRLDPAWRGRPSRPWPGLEVRQREGCDLLPVDVRTTQGRLTLTAYVWPDQSARHERLRGALALAQQTAPTVRRAGAGDGAPVAVGVVGVDDAPALLLDPGDVLDVGVVECDQFDHRRMQLVGVELWGSATFEV